MIDPVLIEERCQLLADTSTGQPADEALADRMASQAERVLIHAKAVAILVADAAEDPRGIVDERALVEDAKPPRLEVAFALERIDEVPEVPCPKRRGSSPRRRGSNLGDRVDLDERAGR